jgi:hypothetical protein
MGSGIQSRNDNPNNILMANQNLIKKGKNKKNMIDTKKNEEITDICRTQFVQHLRELHQTKFI